jgi:8-oxo-dGTP diphosphatase
LRTDAVKVFCHFCGRPLTKKCIEGRLRLYCTACNRPIYENPIPATCVIVFNAKRQLLLVKRSVEPKIGQWCLPGGFIELGEAPEAGALRELAEETGLRAPGATLLGVRTTPSPLYHSVLMVAYAVEKFSGVPVPGDDAELTRWFSPFELPAIAFDSHRYFIDLYLRDHA